MHRLIEKLARETIAVHLSDGTSLKGVLVAVHGDCIVLESAVTLTEEGHVPIDGQAVLPRAKIAWLQRLIPEA
jgi:small nuclear ribonucleoprotein (snRNP)-like protein